VGRGQVLPYFPTIYRKWPGISQIDGFYPGWKKYPRPDLSPERLKGSLQNKLNFLRNILMKIAFSAG
jgi:hypothetical protein